MCDDKLGRCCKPALPRRFRLVREHNDGLAFFGVEFPDGSGVVQWKPTDGTNITVLGNLRQYLSEMSAFEVKWVD